MNISQSITIIAAQSLTILFLASSPSLAAEAGELSQLKYVGLTSEDTKTAAVTKESKATAKTQTTSNRTGFLMRCWNFGRLVYESPVGGFVTSSTTGNVVTTPGTPPKQILDMRSGLCVIE